MSDSTTNDAFITNSISAPPPRNPASLVLAPLGFSPFPTKSQSEFGVSDIPELLTMCLKTRQTPITERDRRRTTPQQAKGVGDIDASTLDEIRTSSQNPTQQRMAQKLVASMDTTSGNADERLTQLTEQLAQGQVRRNLHDRTQIILEIHTIVSGPALGEATPDSILTALEAVEDYMQNHVKNPEGNVELRMLSECRDLLWKRAQHIQIPTAEGFNDAAFSLYEQYVDTGERAGGFVRQFSEGILKENYRALQALYPDFFSAIPASAFEASAAQELLADPTRLQQWVIEANKATSAMSLHYARTGAFDGLVPTTYGQEQSIQTLQELAGLVESYKESDPSHVSLAQYYALNKFIKKDCALACVGDAIADRAAPVIASDKRASSLRLFYVRLIEFQHDVKGHQDSLILDTASAQVAPTQTEQFQMPLPSLNQTLERKLQDEDFSSNARGNLNGLALLCDSLPRLGETVFFVPTAQNECFLDIKTALGALSDITSSIQDKYKLPRGERIALKDEDDQAKTPVLLHERPMLWRNREIIMGGLLERVNELLDQRGLSEDEERGLRNAQALAQNIVTTFKSLPNPQFASSLAIH